MSKKVKVVKLTEQGIRNLVKKLITESLVNATPDQITSREKFAEWAATNVTFKGQPFSWDSIDTNDETVYAVTDFNVPFGILVDLEFYPGDSGLVISVRDVKSDVPLFKNEDADFVPVDIADLLER